jgi:hypothetical protein
MYGIFVNHDLFFNPKQNFQDGDICQPWTQSSLSYITNLLSHVGCSHDTGDCLLSVLKKETC